jgi:hypothetical protein
MAIQFGLDKNHEDNDYGFNYDDAYFKIENIRIDIERNRANIELRGYASKTARNKKGSIGVYKKIYKCSLEDLQLNKAVKKDASIKDAIKTAAYKHLRAKYFKDGKDV